MSIGAGFHNLGIRDRDVMVNRSEALAALPV